MHIKKITFIVAGLLATSAYADISDQTTVENLTNELQALQAKVDAYAKARDVTPTTLESHAEQHLVRTDAIDPYGFMSDTGFAYSVLESKNNLNNPIILGAELEADAQVWSGNNIEVVPAAGSTPATYYHNGTGAYLTTANLYVVGNLNQYITGVVSFGPGLGNPNNGYEAAGYSNLAVNLKEAFFNFGNLQKSPFYLTVGNNYLPFGAMNFNAPWSNTILTNAFRTASTNQLMGGWSDYGLNFNAGVYQNAYFSNNNLNDYLLNLEYLKNVGKYSVAAGVSYLNDIRGTNNGVGTAYNIPIGTNGNPNQQGAALSGNRTGAIDGNLTLGYGAFSLAGEYVTTTDGTPQTKGADLDAWMAGVSYTPTLYNMPTSFAVSYSSSDNMQNVPIPFSGDAGAPAMTYTGDTITTGNGMHHEWLFNVTPEVTTNVYIGPEFEYATLYNGQNTWALTLDATAFL